MHADINTYCMYNNNSRINDNNNDDNINNRYVQLHVRWYCERIDLNPNVHELYRFVAFHTKWFHAVSASGHKGLPGCQGRFWAETSWSMRPWVQKECGRDLNQEVFVCLWRCCDILKHSPVFSLQHSSCYMRDLSCPNGERQRSQNMVLMEIPTRRVSLMSSHLLMLFLFPSLYIYIHISVKSGFGLDLTCHPYMSRDGTGAWPVLRRRRRTSSRRWWKSWNHRWSLRMTRKPITETVAVKGP